VPGQSARVEPRTTARRLRRRISLAVVVLALALLLRAFVLQAFWIPTASMEPTLVPGDRVLVSKLTARLGGVHRGDVVVFEDPRPEPEADGSPALGMLRWVLAGLGVAHGLRSAGNSFPAIESGLVIPGRVVGLAPGGATVPGARLKWWTVWPSSRSRRRIARKRCSLPPLRASTARSVMSSRFRGAGGGQALGAGPGSRPASIPGSGGPRG